jgi:hypothetical protein
MTVTRRVRVVGPRCISYCFPICISFLRITKTLRAAVDGKHADRVPSRTTDEGKGAD